MPAGLHTPLTHKSLSGDWSDSLDRAECEFVNENAVYYPIPVRVYCALLERHVRRLRGGGGGGGGWPGVASISMDCEAPAAAAATAAAACAMC